MDDFASWMDFGLCLCVIVAAVYAWGRVRTALAGKELRRAEKLLAEEKPGEAVKCLEHLRRDLDSHPRYWYTLGLAFARMGSAGHAEEAFRRVLTIEAEYLNTRQLLETLVNFSAGSGQCPGGQGSEA